MTQSKKDDLILTPALISQVQSEDWSDVDNTSTQALHCPWIRFVDLTSSEPKDPVPKEYIRHAVCTAEAWTQSMEKELSKIQQDRAEGKPQEHTRYGSAVMVLHHSANTAVVAHGLGCLGIPRQEHATDNLCKRIIEIIRSSASDESVRLAGGKGCVVYWSSGRITEKMSTNVSMVRPGWAPTEFMFCAFLSATNLRTAEQGATLFGSIAGVTKAQAEGYATRRTLRHRKYSSPPDHYGATVIASYFTQHSQEALMVTGRYLTNIKAAVLDIQADSAGTPCVALVASIINQWPDRIRASPKTDRLRIDNFTITGGFLRPEQINDILGSKRPRITMVPCDLDMLSASGDPGPQMMEALRARPKNPGMQCHTTITGVRFAGQGKDLQRAFGKKLHNNDGVCRRICPRSFDIHATDKGPYNRTTADFPS